MGKFAEFLDKVMADETARTEFDAVIGVRKERELNDGDFQKIVGLSEKLGVAVTLDEVKDFFSGNGRELSEEELAGVVAGGSGGVFVVNPNHWCWKCPYCGRQYDSRKRYDPSESEMKEETMNQIMSHFLMHECYYFQNENAISREWARQKAEEIINMEFDIYAMEKP